MSKADYRPIKASKISKFQFSFTYIQLVLWQIDKITDYFNLIYSRMFFYTKNFSVCFLIPDNNFGKHFFHIIYVIIQLN